MSEPCKDCQRCIRLGLDCQGVTQRELDTNAHYGLEECFEDGDDDRDQEREN